MTYKISYLMMFSFILLSACAPSFNPSPEPPTPVSEFFAKSGVVTGSGDMGVIGLKDSKLVTLKITNNGDEILQGPPSIDNNEFSMLSLTGCENIAPKKYCQIKVSFSATGKSVGLHSSNLTLDNIVIPLSVTIEDPNPPGVSFSSSPLDFGTITDKQNVQKTLTITNSGSSTINSSISGLSNYTINSDACSGKNLASKKTCQVRINLSGAGKNGPINEILTFAGLTLDLTGTVIASVPMDLSQLTFLYNSQPETSHNLGTFTGSKSLQLILTVKNTGAGASLPLSAGLDNSNYSIIYNQCTFALAKNQSCQIRILFSSGGKNPGV